MTDSDYSTEYFRKHQKSSFINKFFIHLIDRREPVFSFLKKNKVPNSKLLDIGCGNGNFLRHATRIYDCEGFDLSEDAIKLL